LRLFSFGGYGLALAALALAALALVVFGAYDSYPNFPGLVAVCRALSTNMIPLIVDGIRRCCG